MIHMLTCWFTSRFKRWRYHQPFWINDKTAKMLNVSHLGCRRCGRGAGIELDAEVES